MNTGQYLEDNMKVRKKPLVVNAIQWTGKNGHEILAFCKGFAKITGGKDTKFLYIDTLEGRMFADVGVYIVKGIKNEYYPVAESVFLETYDIIDE